MKRHNGWRRFRILAGATAAVLMVFFAQGACAATYYIDPSGGDNAKDGLSSSSAKRDWNAFKITSGNTYLQKAGTVWRGAIYLSDVENVRMSMYGEGVLPKLTNSVVRSDWKRDAARQLDYLDSSFWFLAEDGKALLRNYAMDNQPSATLSPGSFGFTKANKRLYYAPSSGKPSDHTVEVPAWPELVNIANCTRLEIDHLELYGFGLHGISAPGVRESRFHHLVVHDGGGANDVFGNGIEISGLSRDCEVDSCRVYNIFDSGISPQYFHENLSSPTLARIRIHDNIVSYCGMDGIEVTAHTAYAKLLEIDLERNTITHSGRGWSGNRGGRGILFNAGVRMGKTPDDTRAQGKIVSNAICDCLVGIGAVGHVDLLLRDNDIDGAGSGKGIFFHDPSNTARFVVEANTLRNLQTTWDIPKTNHAKLNESANILSNTNAKP